MLPKKIQNKKLVVEKKGKKNLPHQLSNKNTRTNGNK
jgi:hypothetical protein